MLHQMGEINGRIPLADQKTPQDEKARKGYLVKLATELKALDDKRRWRKIDFFNPYLKQQEFFDLGSVKRERLLSAGNQLGKSEAGAVEMAYHLTGEYPDDWMGKRWERPIKAWACGESGLVVRDVQQKKLFGEPGLDEALGTGFVPKAAIHGKPSMARGVTDAFDTVHVAHKTNGVFDGYSVVKFKSYEQGRLKFQGDTVDLIWLDEECDEDIYTECLTRGNAVGGIVYVTFTPLKGKTKLYIRFTDDNLGSRGFINIVMEDACSLPMYDTREKRRAIEDSYPAHEREARIRGVPMQGSGRIFITPETSMYESIDFKSVPLHWTKLWAIDFGINIDHQFAASLQAWDKDLDIIHLLHAFKMPDATPLQHAVQMKQIGILVPVIWPHDGGNREKGSGESIIRLYKKQGLKTHDTHATFEDGGYSTEAGVMEMVDRIATGRLKVAQHLSPWFEEYRDYHRKDGLIVKKNDDLMSCTRIGIMGRRFGRPVILGNKAPHKNNDPNAGVAAYAELSGSDLF